MAIFKLGFIIRKRREELGLSQEDLADGICAVPTLSRIENGERLPTKNHLEMLLQRLGYSDALLDSFVDEEEYNIHELKFRIRQAYISKDFEQSKKLLNEYEEMIAGRKNDSINNQFLTLYKVLLYADEYSNAQKLAKFEEAIRLTYPKYKKDQIPHVLSYEEIILLNGIANFYALNGDCPTAIEMLYSLKRYYDDQIVNTEEALRTQPMVLYNLSKWLGLEDRYDECIEISNIGIRIAKTSGRCTLLGKTLFNLSWALIKRGFPEDFDTAQKTAVQALQITQIMGQTKFEKLCHDFISENFPDSIDLLL